MNDLTQEVGEFKGNKTFSIKNGEKRVVTFGINKAKAILACVDGIKKFVEENDKPVVNNEETSEN